MFFRERADRSGMTVNVTMQLPSVLADVAGGRRTLAVQLEGEKPTSSDLLESWAAGTRTLCDGCAPSRGSCVGTSTCSPMARTSGTRRNRDPVDENVVVLVLPAVAGG